MLMSIYGNPVQFNQPDDKFETPEVFPFLYASEFQQVVLECGVYIAVPCFL